MTAGPPPRYRWIVVLCVAASMLLGLGIWLRYVHPNMGVTVRGLGFLAMVIAILWGMSALWKFTSGPRGRPPAE